MDMSLTADPWAPDHDTDADLIAACLTYAADPASGWSIFRPAVRA